MEDETVDLSSCSEDGCESPTDFAVQTIVNGEDQGEKGYCETHLVALLDHYEQTSHLVGIGIDLS